LRHWLYQREQTDPLGNAVIRRPINAVISPIITDYQAQQLAVHANHQRQKAERLAREANPSL
jgi:hypothetical protein